MSDQRDKDIPSFGLEVEDTRLRQKLEAMREAIQKLMGTRGVGGGRAAVRWDDLQAGGFVSETGRLIPPGSTTTTVIVDGGGGGGGTDPTPDLTKPPTPTGLAAVAGLGNVLVEWGAPIYTAGRGHKQTNIYATKQPADDNTAYTINDAVRVDSAVGPLTVIALPSDLRVKWRIWIRFESNDGVESDPAGGVNGVVVTTGRIGTQDLGDLVVQAGNLAAGAVTVAKFGAGIEPVTIITAASLPTIKSTNAIYWSGKLYRWNGTAYVATVPTTDLSGQVTDAQIAAMAAAKLTGQITSTQVTDGAISTPKLAAGAVMTDKIFAGAITAEKIAANTITANEIAANAITASELAADAVTAGKIQAGAITANKLAANAIAVGTAAVENGAINNAMIGNAVIDDAKVANLSAAKLTAGDGTIGGNLRSTNYNAALQEGWIVRPDGYAEFSNVVARGTVFASQGAIGGSLIGSNYIQSTNWLNLENGWRFNNNGTGQIGGIAILLDRIQSGNYSENAQGFAWRADGTGQIGGLKVTATGIESHGYTYGQTGFQIGFDGLTKSFASAGARHLNMAATGAEPVLKVGTALEVLANGSATFGGTLTADAVNAVNTINIADEAVTVPVGHEVNYGGGGSLSSSEGAYILSAPESNFGGGRVLITVAFCVKANASTQVFRIQIRRNGAVIRDIPLDDATLGFQSMASCFVDNPGSAAVVYSARVVTNSGAFYYKRGAIIALGGKK